MFHGLSVDPVDAHITSTHHTFWLTLPTYNGYIRVLLHGHRWAQDVPTIILPEKGTPVYSQSTFSTWQELTAHVSSLPWCVSFTLTKRISCCRVLSYATRILSPQLRLEIVLLIYPLWVLHQWGCTIQPSASKPECLLEASSVFQWWVIRLLTVAFEAVTPP